MECASAFDVMKIEAVVTDEQYKHALELCERITAMLTKLIGF